MEGKRISKNGQCCSKLMFNPMSIASKEVLPYLVVMTSLDEGCASHVCGIVPDR